MLSPRLYQSFKNKLLIPALEVHVSGESFEYFGLAEKILLHDFFQLLVGRNAGILTV